MNPIFLFIIFPFIFNLYESSCLTRSEIDSNSSFQEYKTFLEMFESKIQPNNDEYFLLDTVEFGKLYTHPENDNKLIRVYEQVPIQSKYNSHIAAALKTSAAQQTGNTHWAPMIYLSVCIFSDDKQFKTVYMVVERFVGDLLNVFADDEDFYNAHETPLSRMKLYLDMYQQYQKIQASNMKHCDINPESFFYKPINDSEYMVVFSNFTTIQAAVSYCEYGTLRYSSPEVINRPTYSTDNMKLKSELFSLALNVIRLELDFYNSFFQKKVREGISDMDAQRREIWRSDVVTDDLLYKPIWAAVEHPDWMNSYFLSSAQTEDKYNMINIFKTTLENLSKVNEINSKSTWKMTNFYAEIEYYLKLIDFGFHYYTGHMEMDYINYKGREILRLELLEKLYRNFFVVIARNIKENNLSSDRSNLPDSIRKMERDLNYFKTVSNEKTIYLNHLTKVRKISLSRMLLI